MTLSEGIRLGAMLKPQGFGAFEADGHTCALGAVMDASGCMNASPSTLFARFPILTRMARCPAHPCFGELCVKALIVHLNDDHQWTREQIADWVETIEHAVSQPVAAPIPEEVTQ